MISWPSHYNAAERVSHRLHRYELIKDGRLLQTEWEEFNLRFYESGECRAVLAVAGFTAIQHFKAYGQGMPDDTDESLVFECVRP